MLLKSIHFSSSSAARWCNWLQHSYTQIFFTTMTVFVQNDSNHFWHINILLYRSTMHTVCLVISRILLKTSLENMHEWNSETGGVLGFSPVGGSLIPRPQSTGAWELSMGMGLTSKSNYITTFFIAWGRRQIFVGMVTKACTRFKMVYSFHCFSPLPFPPFCAGPGS